VLNGASALILEAMPLAAGIKTVRSLRIEILDFRSKVVAAVRVERLTTMQDLGEFECK
jgi:hypothetical protein